MLPYAVVSYEYDPEFDVNTQHRRYFKILSNANAYMLFERVRGHDAWVFNTDSEEFEWIKE
jgi:homoserine acetyltransferase